MKIASREAVLRPLNLASLMHGKMCTHPINAMSKQVENRSLGFDRILHRRIGSKRAHMTVFVIRMLQANATNRSIFLVSNLVHSVIFPPTLYKLLECTLFGQEDNDSRDSMKALWW